MIFVAETLQELQSMRKRRRSPSPEYSDDYHLNYHSAPGLQRNSERARVHGSKHTSASRDLKRVKRRKLADDHGTEPISSKRLRNGVGEQEAAATNGLSTKVRLVPLLGMI